jgi:SAM-dependent methyltransferase
MDTVIEYKTCPACGHERTVDLVPGDEKIDTTLDLIDSRRRTAEFANVDLSPLATPEFAICANCALIFLRKRSTPEAARRYYGKLFHAIEAPLPFETLPIPEGFLERRTKIARDLIGTLADRGVFASVESVLYVRCNAGEALKILRDEHGLSELYALEYLPSLIRHAREVWGLANVAPLHGPEFENPFPRETFDLIICNETFGHAHDPAGVAATLKSLLAEDGLLVVYNEKDHSKILSSPKLFPHGMNFFHKQLFTRKSLRLFLELCGFEVEELPHPAIGKISSVKNTKILYLARASGAAAPHLPSDELDAMIRSFRKWRSTHKWYRRWRRILSLIQRRAASPTGGGEARR